jgi:MFS family permease
MTELTAPKKTATINAQTYTQRLILSLSIPGYRWLWISTVFGTMRLITIFIARGWLVLSLTDSPFWVGLAVAMRGVTHIAAGIFAGVLLDRVNRHLMLFLAELGTSLIALVIAVLILIGRIELWHILAASMLEGVFVSIRWPAINTMMYEAVGPKRLLNATATQMLGFNLGHIVAAAIAGQLIEAFGTESGYFFAAICGLTGALVLLFVRGSFKPQASSEKFGHALRSGLRYIWGHGSLRYLITLSFIMALLGWSHISMMPVMARDVLGVGASGLGFLTSAGASGALIATCRTGRL